MPDLQQTTAKVIAVMAKYDADHDITPGLPVVNYTEMSILNILVDMLTILNDQQQQLKDQQQQLNDQQQYISVLRAAQHLKSEPEHAIDQVH